MNRPPAWRLFWAKTFNTDPASLGEEGTHPLWAHLIDVANVADMLWEAYVPEAIQSQMVASIGASQEEARQWFALWIGLHDAGKAIPCFQALHPPSWEKLNEAGCTSRAPQDYLLHHGHATIPILFQWVDACMDSEISEEYWKRLALLVGYHHGRLYTNIKKKNFLWIDRWRGDDLALGGELWQPSQQTVVSEVVDAWTGGGTLPLPRERSQEWPSWLLGFAGWVTLADWIGSMSQHFPKDVSATDNLTTYIGRSRDGARSALAEVGLLTPAPIVRTGFSDLFNFDTPRRLQEITRDVPLSEEAPSLTIIEAPTGEGKTEAAFQLAARQQEGRANGGIYIALPTQATSNGLLPRMEKFVGQACDSEATANLVLLHGGADLHPSRQRLLGKEPAIHNVHDNDTAREKADIRSRTWFLPKKRGLLSAFGIGTVDQAFLSILYSKHFFLRLLGLAGKTVIFDEVHAYDFYMSRLFDQLLGWLRALGANVVVLSATLPSDARNWMLQAWAPGVRQTESQAAYPAVWHVLNGELQATAIESGDVAQLHEAAVKRHSPIPRDIIRTILSATTRDEQGRGACVAVIINTVHRAQEIYRMLAESSIDLPDEDIWLLHARLPHGIRAEREEAVVERFGPKREPGRSGVLVATQVAEQSLDLDFDLMLSDLAPIDLLLQRAGRLHRHQKRHEAKRPCSFSEPRLHVLYPEAEDGNLPVLEEHGLGFVYDSYVLYRTWDLIRHCDGWTLPEDYRSLIESVYGEGDQAPEDLNDASGSEWTAAKKELDKKRHRTCGEAEQRIIPPADELQRLLDVNRQALEDDEDPSVHRDLKALTRWSEVPSVDVVCLHRRSKTDDRLYLDPDYRVPAPLDCLSDRKSIRRLLQQSVRLSGKRLVPHLQAQEDPDWSEIQENTPALFYHQRLVFTNRQWKADDGSLPSLRYDDALGIVIDYPY